jgi:hypothetical protein
VRSGRITAIRAGNAYLFDPRHLADWLATRTTNSGRGGMSHFPWTGLDFSIVHPELVGSSTLCPSCAATNAWVRTKRLMTRSEVKQYLSLLGPGSVAYQYGPDRGYPHERRFMP